MWIFELPVMVVLIFCIATGIVCGFLAFKLSNKALTYVNSFVSCGIVCGGLFTFALNVPYLLFPMILASMIFGISDLLRNRKSKNALQMLSLRFFVFAFYVLLSIMLIQWYKLMLELWKLQQLR